MKSTVHLTDTSAFEVGDTLSMPIRIEYGFLKLLFCWIFRIKLPKYKYYHYRINNKTSTCLTIEVPPPQDSE